MFNYFTTPHTGVIAFIVVMFFKDDDKKKKRKDKIKLSMADA